MDFCDRSQENENLHRSHALRRAKSAIGSPGMVSNMVCIDCGEDIPRVRREAVPGCTRCVSCQQEAEG